MKKIVYLYIALFLVLQTTEAANKFDLIKNNTGATIHYTGNEQVVQTAIDILISDSRLVCETPFMQVNNPGNHTVIVGIPGKEPQFRALLDQYGIEYAGITGQWEAYQIIPLQTENKNYLLIIGSDPRGTAYGILELSRQIGVSPWVWWADVVPEKKANVQFTPGQTIQAPSVQYRGIFLNDEDWGLMPWSSRTFEPSAVSGAIGPKTYSKIFELLLRLRANTIWPAMHECTIPFFSVEGNKEMAEKYGIVLSTSHAEPMMRTNTGEWDNNNRGAFNFLTNREQVLTYWEERVKQLTQTENIYTIGMRGIHDGRMQGVNSIDEETDVLRTVIEEQRNMLQRNNPEKNVAQIPQIFVPYKEVLKAYDNGLNLPEDVTLVWCDDNHGYLTRLSNPEEQKRAGGAGVYYHVSYWGKPHDYLWLGSTQPGLIYAEMKRAWDQGARRLWILNVGDIKPNEYLTEFFLDMAWDINSFAGNTIYAHQKNWLDCQFGETASADIHTLLQQYYQLAAQRKPDHMGWNRVEDWSLKIKGGLQPVKDTEFSSVALGDEIERRVAAYHQLADLSTKVFEKEIPEQLKAAYFQLVHYPVVASGAMNRKILYAQKAREYAEQNPALACLYSRLATQAYNEIAALDYTYNKDMLNGKWELMMDMKPRNLPVYQAPVLPALTCGSGCEHQKIDKDRVASLPDAAGTPVESDRMVALNACTYVNNISLEHIESLGHSGRAVRLPAAKKIHPKQPHLAFQVTTSSHGDVKIKVGTIPMHPVYGKGEMRYAIVIDNQKPFIVSTRAEFLSEKWAENVLRNQSLTITYATISDPGQHTIRIYALDEEMIFDQLMLDFDLERKHYIIPAGTDVFRK